MKKIALMMWVLGVSVFGAETYTIQVISAQKESSITSAFQKKVDKSGFKSAKKKEGDRYVVTVGVFKDKEEAKKAVSKVRERVVCDAFVRPVDRMMASKAEPAKTAESKTAPASKTTQIAAVAKAIEEPKKESATVSDKVEEVAKALEKESAIKHPEVVKAGVEVAAAPSVKEEATPKRGATFVFYDNKALYKHDIAEAIQYYKTSPYHRFEPSGLKR